MNSLGFNPEPCGSSQVLLLMYPNFYFSMWKGFFFFISDNPDNTLNQSKDVLPKCQRMCLSRFFFKLKIPFAVPFFICDCSGEKNKLCSNV